MTITDSNDIARWASSIFPSSAFLDYRPDEGEVYLAFDGFPELHVAGFLVSMPESIDRTIAFCPIASHLEPTTRQFEGELLRSLQCAAMIAKLKHVPSAPVRARDGSFAKGMHSAVDLQPALFAAVARLGRAVHFAIQRQSVHRPSE